MKFRIVTNGTWYQVQHKSIWTFGFWRDSWHKRLYFNTLKDALEQIDMFQWKVLDENDPEKIIYYEEALKLLRSDA